LHVAFAETPYDAGEHIRGKSGGLDPTVGELIQKLDKNDRKNSHERGQHISYHSDQEDIPSAILIREGSYMR